MAEETWLERVTREEFRLPHGYRHLDEEQRRLISSMMGNYAEHASNETTLSGRRATLRRLARRSCIGLPLSATVMPISPVVEESNVVNPGVYADGVTRQCKKAFKSCACVRNGNAAAG